MSKLNNWFISNSEFVKCGVFDDLTSGNGNYNGRGDGFGSGDGFSDENGKVIAYNTITNVIDGGIGCGSGEVNGEGSHRGDNASGCGNINGREYFT